MHFSLHKYIANTQICFAGCVSALFSYNVPESTAAYVPFHSKNILIFVEFEIQLAG